MSDRDRGERTRSQSRLRYENKQKKLSDSQGSVNQEWMNLHMAKNHRSIFFLFLPTRYGSNNVTQGQHPAMGQRDHVIYSVLYDMTA